MVFGLEVLISDKCTVFSFEIKTDKLRVTSCGLRVGKEKRTEKGQENTFTLDLVPRS